MKTILVLTDLSAKAENAAFYALKIAEKTNAKIILYHAIAHHMEGDDAQAPDSANLEKTDHEKLHILADLLKFAAASVRIETVSKNEDLGHSVKQLVSEHHVDMIVMGSKGNNAVDDFLFGSDTYNVLYHISCPILFIPDGGAYQPIKTIVFADDLKNKYPKAVEFLIDIAKIEHAEIIITHFGEELTYNQDKYLDLYKNDFNYERVTIRQIDAGNVQDWLIEIITRIKADLLVMIHHDHKLYGEHIAGSNSQKMLHNHPVPLLILPD